jgi:hypothetical protein
VRDGVPLPVSAYTTRRSVSGRSIDDIIDPARALDAHRQGATLVFQSLQTHWPPLGAFCRDLTMELGAAVQANAYLSPHEARGLDVHYDTHDVAVLQVAGAKDWEVFAPAFADPLPSQHWSVVRPHDGPPAPEPTGDPVVAVTLRPGDSLFVPRGWVHRARTSGDASLHITVGIHVRTWHSVLEALRTRAEHHAAFRGAIPDPPDDTDLKWFRQELHDWIDAQDLSAVMAVDHARHLASTAGFQQGVLVDSLAPIDDATRLAHRHRRPQLTLTGDEDEVALRTPDRVLRLPARARPAVEAVLVGDELRLADLAPYLDGPGRLVLARRLVADGVLRIDRGPEPA